MLLLFIVSICLLIISGNILTFFFGWDGLGITSYFLVSFYFNFRASTSAITTLMSNRVGDCIFFVVLIRGFYFWINIKLFSLVILLFLCFTGFTKSAQFPFSSWLPLAIAAPTPISALVHSSTLVTAGVFLILKFILINYFCLLICFFISLITLFQSGILSLLESDLKKLVAFSTLNQIGFILLTISSGFFFLSISHLIIHAIFKSLLFLSVGVFIHLRFSSQNNFKYLPMICLVSIGYSLLCLVALCFVRGIYSKDFIFEIFFFIGFNRFILIFVILRILFTFLYSFRMLKRGFYLNSIKISNLICSWYFIIPLSLLSYFALMFGKLFFRYYLIIFFVNIKIILLRIIFIIYFIFLFSKPKLWVSVDLLTSNLSKLKIIILNNFYILEKSWLELNNNFIGSFLFINRLKKYNYYYLTFLLVFLIIIIFL